MTGRVEKLLKSHRDLTHTQYRTIKYLSIWEQGAEKTEPLVIRKAKGLKLLLEETPPIILEAEVIVGLRTLYSELLEGENVFGSSYMLPVKPATMHKKHYYPEYLTEEEVEAAIEAGIRKGASTSHVPFGTSNLLKNGIKGIITQAEKRVRTLSEDEPQHKRDFLEAVVISLQATSDFIKKHGDEAHRLAEIEENMERRAELEQIAQACRWVSTEPVQSFYEAVQLFWLFSVVMAAENMSCIPIGRLDQDLWPYLEADLDSGTTTLKKAQELIECLWIKLNFESDLTTDTCRNITLGGTDAEGNDATNPLSYICLDASRNLRLADPKLNVRFHKDSPERLWKDCVDLVKVGLGGFPAFYSDESIVASFQTMGVPLEEARLYSCDGCQEIIIPGKGDFYPVHTAVSFLDCVQDTLGVTPTLVEVGSPVKVSEEAVDYATFEDYMSAYMKTLDKLIEAAVTEGNNRDKALASYSPVPFLSSTLEGCIENAMDKTSGGCTYNWTGCNGQAFASAVNSLAAIKKMVYDNQIITIRDLRHQLEEDWPDEALRQYALNRVPKWGNDDDYVDSIAVNLAEYYLKEVRKYRNPRGGPYYPGIFTFHHVSRGIRTTASPDGRHLGDTVSAHLSPQAGTDKSGPTMTINSALKVINLRLPEGTALDLRFHPTALMGQEATKKMEFFIKSFMNRGGTVIQFNVVDSETLLKAQADPEQYSSLLVRVWGFSAYFTTLTKEYQDEIISRTEHGIT
ncbi:MAG: hypothetical protein NWE89_03940 [Candidatus Bathyarchaeota archaeon]|nr:hypothetical protein [Candidatus Bathyarchaeota archaeon]